jgi:hypothetical protein
MQRATPLTLAQWLARCPSRDEAMARAHRESMLSMTAIGRELGLSVSRVSRIIAARESGGSDTAKAKGKT